MMFPERRDQLLAAMEDAGAFTVEPEEDTWYLGQRVEKTGTLYASGAGVMVDAKRRRIRLIEGQYRKPALVKIVTDGPFRGSFFNPKDLALADHAGHYFGSGALPQVRKSLWLELVGEGSSGPPPSLSNSRIPRMDY